MALDTSTARSDIAKIYIAAFNRAPDAGGLDFWTKAYMGGTSLSKIAEGFASSQEFTNKLTPNAVTNSEYVAKIYLNVFGRTVDSAGSAFWTAALDSGKVTKAGLLNELVAAASANGSNDGQMLANKATVGVAYATSSVGSSMTAETAIASVTADSATVTTAIAAIAAVANTVTLTNGTDSLVGNVFNAPQAYTPSGNDRLNSLQDEDKLVGTGTNPTLNVTLGTPNDNGGNTITPTMSGVETVNAKFTSSTNPLVLSMQDTTGIKTVNISNISGGQNADIRHMKDTTTTLSVSNSVDGASSVGLGYLAGQLASSTDSVTLNLNGAYLTNLNIGLNAATNALAGTGIETLNIASNTTASQLTGNLGISATTVNVTGSANVDLGTITSTNMTTLNASTFTGNLTADVSAGVGARNAGITGGSGNDTFKVTNTNIAQYDTIDGGTGTNALTFNSNVTAGIASGATISNIQTLTLGATGNNITVSADASVVGGLTTIKLVDTDDNNANAETFTLTKLSPAQAIAISITNANTTDTQGNVINAQLTDASGTNDTVNVDATAYANAGSLTLNATGVTGGVENIGVTFGSDTRNHDLILTSNANHTKTLTLAGGTTSYTISDNTDWLVATTVAASGVNGNLNLQLGVANQSVTGGKGNDTFYFGTNFNNSDSINGGDGTDTLVIDATAVSANLAVSTAVTASNIEKLNLAASSSAFYNFSGNTIPTINMIDKDVQLDGAANDVTSTATSIFNISGLSGLSTVTYNSTAGNGTFAGLTSSANGFTGTNDSLTVTANSTAAAIANAGTLTVDGLENLTMTLTNTAANGMTFTGVTSDTLKTVVVTEASTAAINLGTIGNSATGVHNSVQTFDASTMTGNLTVTLNSMASGGSVKLGTGANTVSVAGSLGTGVVINGNTGNDSITGSDQADIITAGNGADTITGGKGADTIFLAESASSADTVVFAANTVATTDSISGFSVANDILQFSVTQSTAVAAVNRISNSNDGAVAAGNAAVAQHVGTAAATLAATTNIIIVDGTHANIAAVLTNIGTTNVVSTAASGAANIDYIVVWSDGTDGHVNIINDANAGGNTMATADLSNDGEVATLLGVTTANIASLTSANFGAFIA